MIWGSCLLADQDVADDNNPDKRGFIAKALTSSGSSFALAFLCTKALLPIRVPLTVTITPAVARCVRSTRSEAFFVIAVYLATPCSPDLLFVYQLLIKDCLIAGLSNVMSTWDSHDRFGLVTMDNGSSTVNPSLAGLSWLITFVGVYLSPMPEQRRVLPKHLVCIQYSLPLVCATALKRCYLCGSAAFACQLWASVLTSHRSIFQKHWPTWYCTCHAPCFCDCCGRLASLSRKYKVGQL